jgi:threonine synthase
MTLLYKSTRDAGNIVSASQAILQGLATDGGLYVPTELS